MRQYIIASHAHFATGIKESVELLSGARDNVHDLSMFVDGRMDVAEEAQKLLAGMSADDDVVVCTDLFGGSVNNEFTKIVSCCSLTSRRRLRRRFAPSSLRTIRA